MTFIRMGGHRIGGRSCPRAGRSAARAADMCGRRRSVARRRARQQRQRLQRRRVQRVRVLRVLHVRRVRAERVLRVCRVRAERVLRVRRVRGVRVRQRQQHAARARAGARRRLAGWRVDAFLLCTNRPYYFHCLASDLSCLLHV